MCLKLQLAISDCQEGGDKRAAVPVAIGSPDGSGQVPVLKKPSGVSALVQSCAGCKVESSLACVFI